MKGIIFTVFNKMIEEKFGLEFWDKMITDVNPSSKGGYTAAGTYDDQELFNLIKYLSNEKRVVVDKLIHFYGEYLILQMSKKYNSFFVNKTLKEFLLSIDSVIHVEVKKIYPDAQLPKFEYEDHESNKLTLLYYSERKLCKLAEGLIDGSAKIFNQKISYTHNCCLKNGDKCCRIEISFED